MDIRYEGNSGPFLNFFNGGGVFKIKDAHAHELRAERSAAVNLIRDFFITGRLDIAHALDDNVLVATEA
jgi:hypothetical protein